jgi:amino acid transporter
MDRKNQRIDWLLRTGDAVAYLIITLFGFSSHGILASSGMVRLLATLLPFYASWVLFASWGDLNRGRYDRLIPWILRSGTTAVLAAPFASTLRAIWLGAPIQATFVLVMAGFSALGIMLWRVLFHFVIRPQKID